MSWKLVFVIEYIGPIVFHPMFYYFQRLFYGRTFQHSPMQESSPPDRNELTY
jgi:very-long-chain enoyl-CoA reductase